jgi:hypothetical protein
VVRATYITRHTKESCSVGEYSGHFIWKCRNAEHMWRLSCHTLLLASTLCTWWHTYRPLSLKWTNKQLSLTFVKKCKMSLRIFQPSGMWRHVVSTVYWCFVEICCLLLQGRKITAWGQMQCKPKGYACRSVTYPLFWISFLSFLGVLFCIICSDKQQWLWWPVTCCIREGHNMSGMMELVLSRRY